MAKYSIKEKDGKTLLYRGNKVYADVTGSGLSTDSVLEEVEYSSDEVLLVVDNKNIKVKATGEVVLEETPTDNASGVFND